MTFAEDLKRKVNEFELDRRFSEAVDASEKAVARAVEKAGEIAQERSGDISQLLDRAGASIDERTDGKYAEKVGRVKDQLNRGVAKVAEQAPPRPDDTRA
jgi:hypothetical protein